MRIIKLESSNVKRLKAISIEPNRHINRVSGANGSGKTSFLDSIEWALMGTRNIPAQPVRKGAGSATIRLETAGDNADEELIITRRLVEGGDRRKFPAVLIEAKDGSTRYNQPQDILDKLVGGNMNFDPLEFIRMKPDQQFKEVRRIVVVAEDLDKLDADLNADELTRREVKKERTALEARRNAVVVPPDLPKEKYDEAALVKRLRDAADFNAEREREAARRATFTRDLAAQTETVKRQRQRVAELRAEADELEKTADANEKKIDEAQFTVDAWEPLAEPRNAAELSDEITKARAVNAAIDRRNEYDKLQAEVNAKEQRRLDLSKQIEARRERKAKILAEAEFPIDGLGFDEESETVLYQGLPFDQISNADQIRVSVAMGMAANPKMRVMRIKDGSLLDDSNMRIIAEMAKTTDYQLFIECVDQSGKVGLYIEDGEIAAVNEEPLENVQAKPKRTRKKKETASA